MKRMKDSKGTITIELSVIFPIFTMIAFGFIFFMHGIAMQIGMGVAAREGARELSLSNYDVYAEDRARLVLREYRITGADVEVKHKGADVAVIVTRPYAIFIPVIGEKEYPLKRLCVFHDDSLEE